MHTAFFYTKKLHIKFLHKKKLLHREDVTQRNFFHSASICTKKFLHREIFTQSQTFTHSKLTQQALTQGNFYTEQVFSHSKLVHKEALAQRSFYTQQVFTQRSCYTGCAKIEKYLLPKHHSAAKDIKNIPHAAAAARNLDAAIPLRSAETEVQNTMELRTAATQIAAPKPHKRRFWRNFKRKIISSKMKKNLLPKHHNRNFHAATTIRFTTLSCKTQ